MVGGTFSAGVAAAYWSEEIQSNTEGKVRVLTDAAFYLNELNHKHNSTEIEDRVRTMDKIVSINSSFPHSACSKANPNSVWKCFFMEELATHVRFPLFFSQSLYDGFHIE